MTLCTCSYMYMHKIMYNGFDSGSSYTLLAKLYAT